VRLGVALATVVFVLVATGSALGARRPPTAVLHQIATGMVTSLDLSHITVGKTTCKLGTTRIGSEAGTFAVGEHVTIACVRGALQTIALAPVTGGPSHAVSYSDSLPWALTPAAKAQVQAAAQARGQTYEGSLSWGSISEAPTTVTASWSIVGPVTVLDPTEIGVDNAVCPLPFANVPAAAGLTAQLYANLSKGLKLGDVISLSCTTTSDGGSTGSISSAA
jgi:hypothetical protein